MARTKYNSREEVQADTTLSMFEKMAIIDEHFPIKVCSINNPDCDSCGA